MFGRTLARRPARSVEFVRRASAVVAIAIAAVIAPAPAFSQPPTPITECGKINKPGLYEVDNDLIASSPSAGDCLIIAAPNVSLNLNRFNLYGATSGVGIHVMKRAAQVFIEGHGSTIETFGVGIQIDASGALADNFTVLSNTDAGVLLNHVQRADLSNFAAINNRNDGVRIYRGGNNLLQMPVVTGSGRYGVWVQSSSHNSIGNFTVQNNSVAGIYIGCSESGPQGPCARHSALSNSNYLFSGIAGVFNSGTQQYGVAIDQGDNFNRVVNVVAALNNQLDLFDVNSDCGKNYWFAEPTIGQVAPPSCIY